MSPVSHPSNASSIDVSRGGAPRITCERGAELPIVSAPLGAWFLCKHLVMLALPRGFKWILESCGAEAQITFAAESGRRRSERHSEPREFRADSAADKAGGFGVHVFMCWGRALNDSSVTVRGVWGSVLGALCRAEGTSAVPAV